MANKVIIDKMTKAIECIKNELGGMDADNMYFIGLNKMQDRLSMALDEILTDKPLTFYSDIDAINHCLIDSWDYKSPLVKTINEATHAYMDLCKQYPKRVQPYPDPTVTLDKPVSPDSK